MVLAQRDHTLSVEEMSRIIETLESLRGARLRGVHLCDRYTLYLSFEGKPKNQLLFWLQPRRGRFLLSDEKRPLAPKNPLAMQMILRKRLMGRRLESMDLMGLDRVVRLSFQGASEALYVELMGRKCRALLVGEDKVVLSSTVLPVEATYSLPEGGVVPKKVLSRFDGQSDVHQQVARYFQDLDRKWRLTEQSQALLRSLRSARKRQLRLCAALEKDEKRADGAHEMAQKGELLKSVLGEVKGKTPAQVEVWDPSVDPPKQVVITLDRKKSLTANMAHFFSRSKALRKHHAHIVERRQAAQGELAHLKDAMEQVEAAQKDEDYDKLQSLVGSVQGATSKRSSSKQKQQRALPYRVFRSQSGRPIWVGKGAKANHELTFRVAAPHDLWLHARGAGGAHVVVPMKKGENVDPACLIDAALLAVQYSRLKNDSIPEVIYTRRKFVSPIKGGPPGLVRLSKEETLRLRREPERLRKLLDSKEK